MKQHNAAIEKQSDANPKGMYKMLGSGFADAAEFRVLASIKDMKLHTKYPKDVDSKAMDIVELAFIRSEKPRYNSKGMDLPFTLDHYDLTGW